MPPARISDGQMQMEDGSTILMKIRTINSMTGDVNEGWRQKWGLRMVEGRTGQANNLGWAWFGTKRAK